MLILAHGSRIPDAAASKAESAYGDDVWRDAVWVTNHLGQRPGEIERAAAALRMDAGLARRSLDALARACGRAGTFSRSAESP